MISWIIKWLRKQLKDVGRNLREIVKWTRRELRDNYEQNLWSWLEQELDRNKWEELWIKLEEAVKNCDLEENWVNFLPSVSGFFHIPTVFYLVLISFLQVILVFLSAACPSLFLHGSLTKRWIVHPCKQTWAGCRNRRYHTRAQSHIKGGSPRLTILHWKQRAHKNKLMAN